MRGVAIGEAHAVLRDAVDVRRRDALATVHPNVGVAEVVGEEEEDVGAVGGLKDGTTEDAEESEDGLHGEA